MERRPARRLRGLVVLSALAAALLIGIDVYTDWLWFGSLGYDGVYATTLIAWWGCFLGGALAFLLVALANVAIARRVAATFRRTSFTREGVWLYLTRIEAGSAEGPANSLALGISAVLAVPFGLAVAGRWEQILIYRNAAPTGQLDPMHGMDLEFYLFALPLLRFAQGWLLVALALAAAGIFAYYAVRAFGFNLTAGREPLPFGPTGLLGVPGVRIHVSALAALAALLIAFGYQLDRFGLVYSTRGVHYGAGYTDLAVVQPALWAASGLGVVVAGTLLVNAIGRRAGWRPVGIALGAWAAIVLLGLAALPLGFQKASVEPSELVLEQPYIERNIEATRRAFAIHQIDEQPFTADPPRPEDIRANPLTVSNIRLWDHRPLLETFGQIQTIRSYYDFADVDIDRYTIGGAYRQVMLAAREMVLERRGSPAQTWVNRRLQFTHGYGVAMSPVNEIASSGLPNLWVKDVPPVGEIAIERPEIYFGERTTGYAIVKTAAAEFDYPKGDENVYSEYRADGGIALDTPLKRLAFSWRLGDGNLLLTNYLRPDSRLLFRRQIVERTQRLAPHLRLDADPYIVVADGGLWWMHDAYTVSDRYPYATPYGGRLNYIRNSVKVVTNTYTGEVRFYVADPADPLISAYRRVFPTLYRPLEELPATLREHMRYPEDLFRVQADVFATYHVQDPRVFYNREDLWAIPQEIYEVRPVRVEPYYVVMRLPGEERPEFLLMTPFSPANKDNMIAWLGARMDREHYGKLLVYKLPKDKLVFGPKQVEARIDQDPEVSAQFTLWSQRGSRVIRGNMLVIPIERSLLYVEPVYLQAEQGQIPELRRVIVATADGLAMEPTLEASLARLFGSAGPLPAARPGAGPAPVPADLTGAVASAVREAQERHRRAQDALRAGDFARYGEEQRALAAALERLVELTGGGR